MVELLTPGVFIQEVNFGPQPIEGVSTSTAGFVGESERGPSSGQPVLITSFPDFQRKFGTGVGSFVLPRAVRGFFENGGARCYVQRVVGSGSAAGSVNPTGSNYNVQIVTTPTVTSGPSTRLTLSSTVGVPAATGSIDLVPYDGSAATTVTVESVDGAANLVQIAGDHGSVRPDTHFVRMTTTASGVTLDARDEGDFSARLSVLMDAQYTTNTTVELDSGTNVTVVSVAGLAVGDPVQFESATAREVFKITAINAATRTLTFGSAPGYATGDKVMRVAWRTTTVFEGNVVEVLENIPASSLANAAADIANRSVWIRLDTGGSSLDPVGDNLPTFTNAQPMALSGGALVAAADGDVIGSGLVPRTGLKALESQAGINIIASPGFRDPSVVGELIGQAERQKDRFAVFDSDNQSDVSEVLQQRALYNSQYAAMYHPWVEVLDLSTNQVVSVPPSGHVIGAYARTDNDRGVFKAPANVVLRGITGFTQAITGGEQDVLNPAGVNALRNLQGLGNVIWGARTITSESLWKYVPVRRLFIFLEQSIVQGTRFAVFEPNDLALWAKLRDAVTNFLTTQWRAGALFGAKPSEAFFVKVDETTTTQDDRDNGRVNIVVGIAPVKPAEFVVFQIGQAPSSVIISES